MREPVQRRRHDVLEPDELLALLEAAHELDRRQPKPATLRRADHVRQLRDEAKLRWKEIGAVVGVSPSTAFYLYGVQPYDKDTIRTRVVGPAVARANDLRAEVGRPAIRAHVTPHTLRRTYITFMVAAGFDLPYVQDQVGHIHPTTTLATYAQVIRRPDREAVRAEMRSVLGEDHAPTDERLWLSERHDGASRVTNDRSRGGQER
jgi:integrase